MSSGMDEVVRAMHAEDERREKGAEKRMSSKIGKELAESISTSRKRISKHSYFMRVAHAVSARATCPRRKVGAILVVNGRIVSSGYNGSPRGLPHCIGVGCETVSGHCIRTVHAEANCLLQAAEHGASTHGATLYTTASPCRSCMSLIINAGVAKIVYSDEYKDESHEDAEDAGAWALDAASVIGIQMIHEPLRPDTGEEKAPEVANAAKEAATALAKIRGAGYVGENSDCLEALQRILKCLDPAAMKYVEEKDELPPWMNG